MKHLILILATLPFALNTFASDSYVDNGDVLQALENVYGIGAGVGGKSDSCLLCHSRASGGPQNINTGFGADFQDAADRLGYLVSSNLQVNGSPSLSELFAEPTSAETDSDDDGRTNAEEFEANTDPADNIQVNSGGSGDGGGCGMITPAGGSNPPPSFLFFLLLPVALLSLLRFRPTGLRS